MKALRFRRPVVLLAFCFCLLCAGSARAALPPAGVYRLPDAGGAAPFTWGTHADDRLVVAVDASAQILKAVVARRSGSSRGAQAPASGRVTNQEPQCEAYNADWPEPVESAKGREPPGDTFCKAQLHVDHARVAFWQASFDDRPARWAELVEARPYVDVLRLPRQAYFYSAPDASNKTPAYVVAGDYVAVLRRSGDFFLADFFGAQGDTRGWLRHEDFVSGHWCDQRAKTPQYTFAAACTENASDDDHVYVDALEVKDRASGRRIQILYDIGAMALGTCSDAVWLADANFDGYPDIVIRVLEGGANFLNGFFLFDPVRRRFELHEGLSELSQPEIDPVKQEIRSAWRDGAAVHGHARYRFASGRLMLLESEVETCAINDDDPGLCEVTTRRLVHGAYVEAKSKRRVQF